MFRTLLVDLPFMSVHRPNLALTLLKAALAEKGYACDVRYAKLAFARQIGVELYRTISEQLPHELLIGDFIFGELLNPCDSRDIEAFVLSSIGQIRGKDQVPETLWPLLPGLRARATKFLTRLADEIAEGNYSLIGLNLTFQITPSLVLAQLLKQRRPDMRVVLGGGNCEGPMGLALHRSFSFLDFVARGEGERLLPALVEALDKGVDAARPAFPLLNHSGPLASISGLVWRDGDRSVANGERAANVSDLDSTPRPDYGEWLNELRASGIELGPSDLSIPFEASRGCWFGEKMHCTFCGLNGPSLAFRSKSPDRVLDELRGIAGYGIPNADAVDLILDMKYFDTLLPRLAEEELNLAIFFELKANITREQTRKLAAAGISTVQPGIESLSSSILSLMRKGSFGYQNLRLLKWLAEAQIATQWNLLYGFPLEDPAEYDRMAAMIPKLVHLQPPGGGCMRVLLNRFSPLFFDAPGLGVENIKAVPAYEQIFRTGGVDPQEIAYYFNFDTSDGRSDFSYVASLRAAVQEWREQYGKAAFTMLDREGRIYLFDTRPDASVRSAELTGIERELYLACDAGATLAGLRRLTSISPAEIEEVMARFVEAGWVLEIDRRYVSLAVDMSNSVPDSLPRSIWWAIATASYRQRARSFARQDEQANQVPARLAFRNNG